MKVFTVENFKYGLDARRDQLTSQLGTLFTLENGHINPGGEIEKRKAFVAQQDLSVFETTTYTITSITRVNYTATATCPANHQLSNGDWVKVSGATQSAYNGEFQVSNVTATTFDYIVQSITATTPATGTPVFSYLGPYGLEVTSVGLLVFGSALVFGTTPTQSQPVLEAAIPSGVTYQQLKHPTLTNDAAESYDRRYHRLTKVIHSINYSGNAFAIALFSDGRRFLYYNGSLVQHSANGLVMTNRTDVADLAVDLERQVEAIGTGWLVTPNVDEAGNAENGSAIVTSPKKDHFDLFPSDTSSAGQIGTKQIAVDIAGTTAALAFAGFQITDFTGTWQLAILNDGDASTIVADLTGGAVTGVTSIAITVAAIARAVNDFSYVHGYTALATSDTVWVYAPPGGDVSSPSLRLRVTYTTGTAAAPGAAPGALVLSTTQTNPTGFLLAQTNTNLQNRIQGNVTCNVAGGTAPYSFAWTAIGQVQNIRIISPAAQTPTFSFQVGDGSQPFLIPVPTITNFTGNFRCTVTDSAATPVTQTIDVLVTLQVQTLAP